MSERLPDRGDHTRRDVDHVGRAERVGLSWSGTSRSMPAPADLDHEEDFVTDPTPRRTVLDVLADDHRRVEGMFVELEGLATATDVESLRRRKDLTELVTEELVRHSVAEEAEVYPRIRERIDVAEADRLTEEQAEAERTMKQLESLLPDKTDFDEQLTALIREIREHVAEEEQQAFPQLREAFSEDELVEMGEKVEAVKKRAPTRPHPAAPDRPPYDKLVGPPTGVIDRLRDALMGRNR
jgi:hemerythrin superfamily protein